MSTTNLVLNQLPRFPAHVSATNGLVAVVENGVDLVIVPDFGSLVPVPAVTNPSLTYFMAWDSSIDYYQSISFQDLADNLAGQVLAGTLLALQGVTFAANQGVYFSDANTAHAYSLSSFVRGISGSSDAAAFRTAIGVGELGATIHAAPAKTALVDADEFGLSDSAASNVLKRVTLANLVSSIFTVGRTIGNANFQASTFSLKNAGNFALTVSAAALTAGRVITMPDLNVDLGDLLNGSASVTVSGTATDITGIPAGVNRIVIAMEVALSGTASIATLQLGTAGGMVVAGYSGAASGIGVASVASIPATGSAPLAAVAATPYLRPVIHLIRQQGTRWLISGMGPLDSAGATVITNSMVTLGAAIDRVRISSQGGSTLTGTATVWWSKI